MRRHRNFEYFSFHEIRWFSVTYCRSYFAAVMRDSLQAAEELSAVKDKDSMFIKLNFLEGLFAS